MKWFTKTQVRNAGTTLVNRVNCHEHKILRYFFPVLCCKHKCNDYDPVHCQHCKRYPAQYDEVLKTELVC